MSVYRKYQIMGIVLLCSLLPREGYSLTYAGELPGYQKFMRYTAQLDSMIFNYRSVSMPEITQSQLPAELNRTADSIFGQRYQSLRKENRSNTGLDLTGSYSYKLGSNVNDASNDIYASYTNRFQLGVNWDIIGSALYKQNKKLKIVELENERLKTDYLYALSGQTAEETRQNVADFFGRQIYQLQKIRLGMFDFLKELVKTPTSEESMTLYLEIQDQWNTISNELNNYRRQGYDSTTVRVFDILKDNPQLDSIRFLSQVIASNRNLVGSRQEISILEAKKGVISYTDNMKVSPFVRGQHYLRPNGSNPTSNIDFGVNLSVPLSAQSKYKKRSIDAERNVAEINQQQTTDATLFKARQILDRQYQLIHAIQQELNRLNLIKHNILNNQMMMKYSDNGYSAPKVIFTYDAYFKSVIQLYLQKQEYMTLLVVASELAGGSPLSEITTVGEIRYQNPEFHQTTKETLIIGPTALDPMILANLLWRNQLSASLIVDSRHPLPAQLYETLLLNNVETSLFIPADEVRAKDKTEIRNRLDRSYIYPVQRIYIDLDEKSGPVDNQQIETISEWGKSRNITVSFIVPYRHSQQFKALLPEKEEQNLVIKIKPDEEASFLADIQEKRDSPVNILVGQNTKNFTGSSQSDNRVRIFREDSHYFEQFGEQIKNEYNQPLTGTTLKTEQK